MPCPSFCAGSLKPSKYASPTSTRSVPCWGEVRNRLPLARQSISADNFDLYLTALYEILCCFFTPVGVHIPWCWSHPPRGRLTFQILPSPCILVCISVCIPVCEVVARFFAHWRKLIPRTSKHIFVFSRNPLSASDQLWFLYFSLFLFAFLADAKAPKSAPSIMGFETNYFFYLSS